MKREKDDNEERENWGGGMGEEGKARKGEDSIGKEGEEGEEETSQLT